MQTNNINNNNKFIKSLKILFKSIKAINKLNKINLNCERALFNAGKTSLDKKLVIITKNKKQIKTLNQKNL